MVFQRIVRLLVILSFALVGCGQQYETRSVGSKPLPESGAETPAPTPPPSSSEPIATPTPTPPPLEDIADPTQNICSRLDFKDVKWPQDLTFHEHTYYALALNITGSFEGHVGWKNITGNFDGQGISLGLLQQNLGQGTLQPLLVEMHRQNKSALQVCFSRENLNSMAGMLEDWLGTSLANTAARDEDSSLGENINVFSYDQLFPEGSAFSRWDYGYEEFLSEQAAGNTARSVAWAKSKVLDSKGNVSAVWKKSFQDMAETPSYRSLQLKASAKLFLKAKAYFEALEFSELRFLLLMFDFVVQNGSIGSQHLDIYKAWLKRNPQASEEQRALALLEARLTTVKDQFKADVRSRKTTLIKGVGVVHQVLRNLSEEYCFDPRVKAL